MMRRKDVSEKFLLSIRSCAIISPKLSPRKIEALKNFPVAAMAGGWGHTLVLTHCGALLSFGGGYRYGNSSAEALAVLGISTGASAAATDEKLGKLGGISPTRVCDDALDSARVKHIKCGWDHCMVVTDDGALFTWGSGRSGQLGHGDTGEIPQFWVSCKRSRDGGNQDQALCDGTPLRQARVQPIILTENARLQRMP